MKNGRKKLLFITQRINPDDRDLAFVILWIREFIRQGVDVEVICLEKRKFNGEFPVHSLGKEKGGNKFLWTLRFLKLIFSLDYDRVFVHMNTEYFTIGGWYWRIMKIPSYLWYTHYDIHIHLKLAAFYAKRMFAATPESLPQYNGSPKKVVTGHGIDIDFWLNQDSAKKEIEKFPEENLVSVHRLARSKRIDLAVRTLKFLPEKYNLTIYGRTVEPEYEEEVLGLIKKEGLEKRVSFKGTVPMGELANIYSSYRLMVNMAPETIDKTVVEAMLFGVFPVTTKGNSEAIGIKIYPNSDSPEDIADFILGGEWKKIGARELREITKKNHSLSNLILKMMNFIEPGL